MRELGSWPSKRGLLDGNQDVAFRLGMIGPNVSRMLYDGKENALWIPYMTEWGGDGLVQKFDVVADSVVWTSDVLGNGSQDIVILEPILSSEPWADAVTSFTPGDGAGFGSNYFPDNVLGPPDPDPEAVGNQWPG